jgi:hypothetical protein
VASPITLYFLDQINPFSQQGVFQRGRGAGGNIPNAADMADAAWQPGAGTAATNLSSDLSYGTVQPAASFTSTLGPANTPTVNNCFSIGTPVTCNFNAKSWSIHLAVDVTSAATSGNANLRIRMFACGEQTGVLGQPPARELTTSTIALTTFAIGATGVHNTTATWTPGAFSLNGETLFVEIALEIQSGAVTLSGTTIELRQDGNNSFVTTADATFPSTLYLVATGGGFNTIPTAGFDGAVDQVFQNGNWYQIYPFFGANSFGASAAFDPNSMGFSDAGTFTDTQTPGTAFLFGSQDNQPGVPASIWTYNGNTNDYLTANPNFPTNANYDQFGACCVLNGITYGLGGGWQDSVVAVSGVWSWQNNQSSSSGTFNTYGNLPSVAVSGMAIAVNNLIYHGGGDNYTTACLNTWYKWNPLTDTRTPLSNIPATVAGSAIFASPDGKFIFLVGGYTSTNSLNVLGTTAVYRYTIATDTWTTMNPFPVPASYASACLWNETLYCTGGFSATATGGFPVPNLGIYWYDYAADKWYLHSTLFSQAVGFLFAWGNAAAPAGTPFVTTPITVRRGESDYSQISQAWFDVDMKPEGWFDADLLVPSAITTVRPGEYDYTEIGSAWFDADTTKEGWFDFDALIAPINITVPFPQTFYPLPPRLAGAHRLLLESTSFYPLPIVSTVPVAAYASYPDRMAVPLRQLQDGGGSVGAPDRTAPTFGVSYPDAILAAYARQHVAQAAIPAAPERSATFLDADFPDHVAAQAPRTHVDSMPIRPSSGSPDVSDVRYPERIDRPLPRLQQATLAVAPAPERTSPLVALDYPAITSGPSPRAQLPVGALPLAPERTAPLVAADFPSAVLAAPPRAQQPVAALGPFPIPSLAAPVSAYASYPDRLPPPPLRQADATTVRAPERTAIAPVPADYPGAILAPAPRQHTDALSTPPAPERNAPVVPVDFPAQVLPVAPRAQMPVAALDEAPERTSPLAAASYPDTVPGTQPRQQLPVAAIGPFPLPSLAAPVGAYTSFPDRLPPPTLRQADATTVRVPERNAPLVPPSHPDQVLPPQPRAQMPEATLPPAPERNAPVVPVDFPSTVPGAQPRQQQPVAAFPPLPQPNLAAPVGAFTSFPERAPGAQPRTQQAVGVIAPVPERTATLVATDYPLTVPAALPRGQMPTAAMPTAPVAASAPPQTPTVYPDTALPPRPRQHADSLSIAPRPEVTATPGWNTSYPDTVPGPQPRAQMAWATLSPRPERTSPLAATWYPDVAPTWPLPRQHVDTLPLPSAPEAKAPLAAQSYPDRIDRRMLGAHQQQASSFSPQPITFIVLGGATTDFPDIVRGRFLGPWLQQYATYCPIPALPVIISGYTRLHVEDTLLMVLVVDDFELSSLAILDAGDFPV